MVVHIDISDGELPRLGRLRKGPLDVSSVAIFHPHVVQRPILAGFHLLSQRDGLAAPHLDAEHTVGEGYRTPVAAVFYEGARFGGVIRHVDAVNIRDVICVSMQDLSPLHQIAKFSDVGELNNAHTSTVQLKYPRGSRVGSASRMSRCCRGTVFLSMAVIGPPPIWTAVPRRSLRVR